MSLDSTSRKVIREAVDHYNTLVDGENFGTALISYYDEGEDVTYSMTSGVDYETFKAYKGGALGQFTLNVYFEKEGAAEYERIQLRYIYEVWVKAELDSELEIVDSITLHKFDVNPLKATKPAKDKIGSILTGIVDGIFDSLDYNVEEAMCAYIKENYDYDFFVSR